MAFKIVSKLSDKMFEEVLLVRPTNDKETSVRNEKGHKKRKSVLGEEHKRVSIKHETIFTSQEVNPLYLAWARTLSDFGGNQEGKRTAIGDHEGYK